MKLQSISDNEELLHAFNKVVADLGSLSISVNNLKEMLIGSGTDAVDDFDPAAIDNKFTDGKLTEKGIEICYRLFDKGHNRNQVASQMGISFTAATHRYATWQSLGGLNRPKHSLT